MRFPSLLLPPSLLFQHAAPEIVVELRGDEQGRFAALGADRSCGDGIGLKSEPFTGPNVDLRNHLGLIKGEQEVVDPAFADKTGCNAISSNVAAG
jgi:hypothetical protein